MNKFGIIAVLFSGFIALTFISCGSVLKSRDYGLKETGENINPFDFGDEFLQEGLHKIDPGTGDKESGKSVPGDTVKTPSISHDYLINVQKNNDTKTPDLYLDGTILGYRVQLGAYENRNNAEKTAKSARSKFELPVYVTYQTPFYRVRMGDFKEKSEAEKYVKIIKEKGFRDARWVPTQINTE